MGSGWFSLNRYGNNYVSFFSIWALHSSPGWLLYLGAIEWSSSKTTSVGRWTVDLFLYLSSRLWLIQRKMVASYQISKKVKRKVVKSVDRIIFYLFNMCFSWISWWESQAISLEVLTTYWPIAGLKRSEVHWITFQEKHSWCQVIEFITDHLIQN